MALIPLNGILYERADVAPSPSKDYCQLLVTVKEVGEISRNRLTGVREFPLMSRINYA